MWEPRSVRAIFSSIICARVAATSFVRRRSRFWYRIRKLNVRSLRSSFLILWNMPFKTFLIYTICCCTNICCDGLVHLCGCHYTADKSQLFQDTPSMVHPEASVLADYWKQHPPWHLLSTLKTVCTVCTTGHIIWNLQQRVAQCRWGLVGPKILLIWISQQ